MSLGWWGPGPGPDQSGRRYVQTVLRKTTARSEGMECLAQEVRWNPKRKSRRTQETKMRLGKIMGSVYNVAGLEGKLVAKKDWEVSTAVWIYGNKPKAWGGKAIPSNHVSTSGHNSPASKLATSLHTTSYQAQLLRPLDFPSGAAPLKV